MRIKGILALAIASGCAHAPPNSDLFEAALHAEQPESRARLEKAGPDGWQVLRAVVRSEPATAIAGVRIAAGCPRRVGLLSAAGRFPGSGEPAPSRAAEALVVSARGSTALLAELRHSKPAIERAAALAAMPASQFAAELAAFPADSSYEVIQYAMAIARCRRAKIPPVFFSLWSHANAATPAIPPELQCGNPAFRAAAVAATFGPSLPSAGISVSNGEVSVRIAVRGRPVLSLTPRCALDVWDASSGYDLSLLAASNDATIGERREAAKRTIQTFPRMTASQREASAIRLVNAGWDVPLRIEPGPVLNDDRAEALARQAHPKAREVVARHLLCGSDFRTARGAFLLAFVDAADAPDRAYAIAMQCPGRVAQGAAAALVAMGDPRAPKALAAALEKSTFAEETLRHALAERWRPEYAAVLAALPAKKRWMTQSILRTLDRSGLRPITKSVGDR